MCVSLEYGESRRKEEHRIWSKYLAANPNKKRKCKKTALDLWEFGESVVWLTVCCFSITVNRVPTVDVIGEKVREAVDFKGGNINVRLVLKDWGFCGRKRNQTGYF